MIEERRQLEKDCVNPFYVNDKDCDRLTSRLFQKLDCDNNKRISYTELTEYVKTVQKHINPKKKFNQEAFDKGFKKLDPTGNGYCEYDQIKEIIVVPHFTKYGLYQEPNKTVL